LDTRLESEWRKRKGKGGKKKEAPFTSREKKGKRKRKEEKWLPLHGPRRGVTLREKGGGEEGKRGGEKPAAAHEQTLSREKRREGRNVLAYHLPTLHRAAFIELIGGPPPPPANGLGKTGKKEGGGRDQGNGGLKGAP